MPNNRIPENVAANIFYQILLGMDFLHDQNVYHRDIKQGNILVSNKTTSKIIDFGFSVKGDGTKLTTYCGTPCYMSPEILRKNPYDGAQADIWALGAGWGFKKKLL